MREWPGIAGPLVHVPDPLAASPLIESLAALVAPRWRVLSLTPRPDVPYQVHLTDVLGVVRQFGFVDVTVVAEGIGCVAALLLAAWHPDHVARLVLVRPRCTADGNSIEATALRDCPPNWVTIRASVQCRLEQMRSPEEVAATLP